MGRILESLLGRPVENPSCPQEAQVGDCFRTRRRSTLSGMALSKEWPAEARSLDEVLAAQDGVICRRQALAVCGRSELRRRLRSGLWVAQFPGVYLTHTGAPTWRQRAWAAVLSVEPAALGGRSAIYAAGGRVDGKRFGSEPIRVVVSHRRSIGERKGVVVQYCSHYARRLGGGSPPRIKLEHAVLDLAAAAPTTQDAVARLAEGIQNRLTTATRLTVALKTRPNTAKYPLLLEILADLEKGTCSVLEREYLTKVERSHGLPAPQRQAPTTVGRKGFRDVDYPEWGVVVELDGRAGHDDPAARDRDMERDLDALVGAARITARLGWGQASTRPCRTAGKIGRLLRRGGWPGEVTACTSPDCTALEDLREL